MRIIALKRLSFAVILILVLSASPISAQIKLQKEKSFANELMLLGDISAGTAYNVLFGGGGNNMIDMHQLYCRIFHDELTIGLNIMTKNRADDDMEIALGDDFPSVSESLQSIIDWIDEASNGMSIKFDDIQGRKVQLNKVDAQRIQVQILEDIDYRTIVGPVYLTRRLLVNAQSLLNENTHNKIIKKLNDLELNDHPFIKESGEWIDSPQPVDALESIKEELRSAKKELRSASKDEAVLIKERINELEIRERIALLKEVDKKRNPNAENLARTVLSDVQKSMDSKKYSLVKDGLSSLNEYEEKNGPLPSDLSSRKELLSMEYSAIVSLGLDKEGIEVE